MLLFSYACTITSELPAGVEEQLPENANRVDVVTDQEVDLLFTNIQRFLTDHGYAITEANDLTHRIDTEWADIGNRTTMRITMRVVPHQAGSKLEAIGLWSTDVEESSYDATNAAGVSVEHVDWWPASWQGGGDRSSFAYASLVTLLHELPATERNYVRQ